MPRAPGGRERGRGVAGTLPDRFVAKPASRRRFFASTTPKNRRVRMESSLSAARRWDDSSQKTARADRELGQPPTLILGSLPMASRNALSGGSPNLSLNKRLSGRPRIASVSTGPAPAFCISNMKRTRLLGARFRAPRNRPGEPGVRRLVVGTAGKKQRSSRATLREGSEAEFQKVRMQRDQSPAPTGFLRVAQDDRPAFLLPAAVLAPQPDDFREPRASVCCEPGRPESRGLRAVEFGGAVFFRRQCGPPDAGNDARCRGLPSIA
jgi:hypothetical protein